ncbi:MAG: oxidoreductase [Leptospiraceae bacterium]
MNSSQLENKVVIVSGGAGRLGRVFSEAIVSEGGVAVIADVDQRRAEVVAEEIEKDHPGAGVLPVELDIRSVASIRTVIENVEGKYGRIDALVNNAYPRNKNYGRKFFEVEYKDFCENMGMHVGGYFLTSQELARHFLGQGYGNIVNISSIYGTIAPRFEIYEGTEMTTPVEYAAIKAAINHLTRYMAQYLKKDSIRVNSLSPGGILDNQPETFLNAYRERSGTTGMLDAKDVTGTLVYLLSDASNVLTGQNIIVDDGFTL